MKVIDTPEIIALIDILITSSLGVWIGVNVTKNQIKNRNLIDYYIAELKQIDKDYSIFLNCLFKKKSTCKFIIEWMKIETFKINSLENSIFKRLNIKPPTLLHKHNTIKSYLTSNEDFNEQFNSDFYDINFVHRVKIIEYHSEFKELISDLIIETNGATSKKLT